MTEVMDVLLVGAGEQAWESRGPSILALSGEGARLAAIADPHPDRAAWAAERLGVTATYQSLTAAVAHRRFDAVILAVPTSVHAPLTLEALAAGCHVLCEKPMARDAMEARAMVDAAARSDRVLTVGYPYPFMHPELAELDLGSVFRIEGAWSRRDGIPSSPAFWRDPTGGAGPDLLGHLLSVVRLGVRRAPRTVTAHAWRRFGHEAYGDVFAGRDTMEALIAFDGGATAHLVVAWAANQSATESIAVTFSGSDCSVEVPLIGRETDVERFRPPARAAGPLRGARRGLGMRRVRVRAPAVDGSRR